MLFEINIKEELYSNLEELTKNIEELSQRYHLISASTATAFLYMFCEDINDNQLSLDSFYSRFGRAIKLIINIEKEQVQITKSDIWSEILLLDRLIQQKEDIQIVLAQLESLNRNSQLDLNFKISKPNSAIVQIGRSSKPEHGNDIIFPNDRTLSRIHLIVSAQNGQLFIEDRSANGTFVNGKKIEKGIKTAVNLDDEIRIGRDNTLVDLEHEKIRKLML